MLTERCADPFIEAAPEDLACELEAGHEGPHKAELDGAKFVWWPWPVTE